jgi:hypothetical protein
MLRAITIHSPLEQCCPLTSSDLQNYRKQARDAKCAIYSTIGQRYHNRSARTLFRAGPLVSGSQIVLSRTLSSGSQIVLSGTLTSGSQIVLSGPLISGSQIVLSGPLIGGAHVIQSGPLISGSHIPKFKPPTVSEYLIRHLGKIFFSFSIAAVGS